MKSDIIMIVPKGEQVDLELKAMIEEMSGLEVKIVEKYTPPEKLAIFPDGSYFG